MCVEINDHLPSFNASINFEFFAVCEKTQLARKHEEKIRTFHISGCRDESLLVPIYPA